MIISFHHVRDSGEWTRYRLFFASPGLIQRDPQKVEEGVTNPENTLPLDINHHKLLGECLVSFPLIPTSSRRSIEWLVDRKQVPENWSDELDQLEKEIQFAMNQLEPSHKENLPPDSECKLPFLKKQLLILLQCGWSLSSEF